MSPVLAVGLVAAALAALLHVWIWVMESLRWTHPATRRVFGTSEEEARVTRALAFNQGFYNLFLAVLVAAGLIGYAVGRPVVGLTLVLAGAGSMLAAALVLGLSSRAHLRAAVTQGALPLVAVLALLLA